MLKKIVSINIELTNICNLSCKMCYRNQMKYPQGKMDYMLFLSLVEQIKQFQEIDTVYFHWRGEPLYCEYLIDAINRCAMIGKKTILFTNGILMNSNLATRILNSKLYAIYFSLEATDEATYQNIRGKNYFDVLKNNISYFCKLKKEVKSNLLVNLSSVILPDNIKDLVDFDKEWKYLVDTIMYKADMSKKNSMQTHKQCIWPESSLFISWDGEVAACCMDINLEYSLGNIKYDSLQEIIISDKRRDLIDSINNNTPIGYCRKCNLY